MWKLALILVAGLAPGTLSLVGVQKGFVAPALTRILKDETFGTPPPGIKQGVRVVFRRT